MAVDAKRQRLLRTWGRLDAERRATLLAFAEFLESRMRVEEQPVRELSAPQPVPRAEGETVVGAVKRLSASYPMLDKAEMFNEVSSLMAQHLVGGREAEEVIEQLEQAFDRRYQALVRQRQE